MNPTERKTRRRVVGVVTSDRMDKTITVKVDRRVQHPQFKKYLTRSTLYKAHDEGNQAQIGDRVSIEECKPLSKTKNFRLVEVIERSRLRAAAQLVIPVSPELSEG
ncbi:MAG TPA: 30S ribosomal protein S17 [Planctomycetota bacterium]|jgi:small subunit ribosomal protein S17|nr:30S ribosomal protein S17 [Planctomycetota bacterium]